MRTPTNGSAPPGPFLYLWPCFPKETVKQFGAIIKWCWRVLRYNSCNCQLGIIKILTSSSWLYCINFWSCFRILLHYYFHEVCRAKRWVRHIQVLSQTSTTTSTSTIIFGLFGKSIICDYISATFLGLAEHWPRLSSVKQDQIFRWERILKQFQKLVKYIVYLPEKFTDRSWWSLTAPA